MAGNNMGDYTAEELRLAELVRKELQSMDDAKQAAIRSSDNKLLDFLKDFLAVVPAILKGVLDVLKFLW